MKPGVEVSNSQNVQSTFTLEFNSSVALIFQHFLFQIYAAKCRGEKACVKTCQCHVLHMLAAKNEPTVALNVNEK